jgi:hypothetical protein
VSRRPRAEPKQYAGGPRKLYPLERYRPLDPGKPLALYRVPPLKAFDRDLPGQLRFDFSSPDPGAVTYAEDESDP